MSCDLINPRKDLPDAANQLYRALKLKSCACLRAWTKEGYIVVKPCSGCVAIDRWEALIQVTA